MSIARLATVVVALAVALASCGRTEQPAEPGTRDARPHAWTKIDVADDDRTLTVHYVGGVDTCYALDRVDVGYGPDSVTVTVYEGTRSDLPPDTACIEIGVVKSATVVLDEPLAGRDLVDGAA